LKGFIMAQSDTSFAGPVPEMYDRFMVPLIFQPYAEDMAGRVAALAPSSVLETAAGSGVVTRMLAPKLGAGARYVVTDLSPPMLERAKAMQAVDGRIEWQAADALSLPYPDDSFDVAFCQFGAMFFPDKPKGYAEARRVLKPGAAFLFNVWDSLAHNEVPATVWQTITASYPDNPPDFFTRIPHGYFDEGRIRADLAEAGFREVTVEEVTRQSHAASARDVAVALCMGTPIRMEILARDPNGLAEVTDRVEAAVRARYGDGPVLGKIQALVVTARA
jgi:ubiquinone/menaquinone biosynthesis C-methylase UbiE